MKSEYESKTFSLKNNYPIHIFINKNLLSYLDSGLEYTNNNGWKNVTKSAYIRKAIYDYTKRVLSGKIESGYDKLHKKNIKRGIII